MPLDRDVKGHLKNLEEAMKFDDYAHAVSVINTAHRHVHDGFFFHMSGRTSLGIGATYNMLISVPAGCYPHFQDIIFNIGDSPGDIFVFEGTTTSADGTPVTAFNRNRNSANTPSLQVFHTPTITGDGSQIHDRYIVDNGGLGSNQIGVYRSAQGEEWVLKPDTKYLVRYVNNSGNAIILGFEGAWYEIGSVK